MRRAACGMKVAAASGLLSAIAFGGAQVCAGQSGKSAATAPATAPAPSVPATSAVQPAAFDPVANPGASAPALAPGVPAGGAPIAIVPLAGAGGATPTVTGALEVRGDKAIIAASGAVTADNATTRVTLPRRGVLSVCASTTVKLAADTSVPKDETPGLLMALDHGAIETDFTTGRNSDMVLTPDFRILISGPGTAELKVRLGRQGDTCVDNAGTNAPYVLVTSLFGGGMYRVEPGQRVMFEHGSLREVVDNEKEPCGCPPPVKPGGNEFPLAQSEGLAPIAAPAPAPPPPVETHLPLVYNSGAHAPKTAPSAALEPQAAATSQPQAGAAAPEMKPKPKRGFFRSIGRFFRRVFGAE